MLKHEIFQWAKVISEELGFLSHFRILPPVPHFLNRCPHGLAKETQCKLCLSCEGGNKYETPNDFSTLGAAVWPGVNSSDKCKLSNTIFFSMLGLPAVDPRASPAQTVLL